MRRLIQMRKRSLLRGGGLLVSLYLGVCWFVTARQEEMIFRPRSDVAMTPAAENLDYKEVWMPVGGDAEQDTLHGYWVRAERRDGEGASRGAVLLLHGNNTTIGTHFVHATQFHDLGCDVLMVDYRNFGNSSAVEELSEQSTREDALAAWRYLRDELGVDPGRTIIFGHSLGGAIAVDLAAEISADADLGKPAGLIVESSFTCVVDMSKERYHGCLRALPLGLIVQHRFDSVRKVEGLEVPKLFIHGTADEKIPHAMSEELHRCAREPKELLLVEGAGHRSCGETGGGDYRQTVDGFLARCLGEDR